MFTNIIRRAKAQIKGGKKYPKINGTVTFKETRDGILVTAQINGLPQSNNSCPGRFFGFHIHEGTSCIGTQSDEFAMAKSHLNPTHCPHPFHLGDLPPLIENNGYAYMRVLIRKFKLNDLLGKVVIIHDSPDDFTTQPSRKFWYKNSLWYNSKKLNIESLLINLIIFVFFFIT